MKILSVNCGSSSLKFQAYEMPEERILIKGRFERIGIDNSFYTIWINGDKIEKNVDLPNHETAFKIVTEELINYYKNLDNYNITLILPVFYNNILDRIRVVEDLEMYQIVDRYLGVIFNNAYMFLTKNNVKVNNSIYVINNDSFKKFTNWFVSRYNNRIEYKTILDLVKDNGSYSNYNVIETPNMNFVVGKNTEPTIEKTVEMELETFDNLAKKTIEEKKKEPRKREETLVGSSGFVSYILLGAISFIVFIGLLYLFVK